MGKRLCAVAVIKVAVALWVVLSLESTEGQYGRDADHPVFMNLVFSQFFSLTHLFFLFQICLSSPGVKLLERSSQNNFNDSDTCSMQTLYKSNR